MIVKNKMDVDETYTGVMLKVHAAVSFIRYRPTMPKWL